MNKTDEKYTIPEGILSDLCSRFIINVPEEERNDLIRIFFQIEIAHWFYLDFYCDTSANGGNSSSGSSSSSSSSGSSSSSSSSEDDEENEMSSSNLIQQTIHHQNNQHQLKPCSIRTFAENIFRHCPFLMQHSNNVDDILNKWKVFKHAVPTNGAIILDESMRQVLLVQGFWSKASWGFPKGKVFEEETEAQCAIREVLEETGYDITPHLNEEQYLQININDQTIRLYLIKNVSKQQKFEPKTRREIKEVRWFAIDDLPVHRKDNRSKNKLGYSPNSFFMVIPFVKSLKDYIAITNGTLNGQIKNGQIIKKHKRHNSTSQYVKSHLSHNTNTNNNISSNQLLKKNKSFKRSKSNENMSLNKTKSSNHLSLINNSSANTTPLTANNLNIIQNSSTIGTGHSTIATSFSNGKKFNPFLKHYSNCSKNFSFNTTGQIPLSAESSPNVKSDSKQHQQQQIIKNQMSFYQKLQQNEFADILGFKETALANKTNKPQSSSTQSVSTTFANNTNTQIGFNSNSKFKPIQHKKNSPYHNGSQTSNQNHPSSTKKIVKSTSTSSGLSNSSINQNGGYLKDSTSKFNSLTHSITINNGLKAKKQLDFSGPECWVNFKFDYDSILQNLPPMLKL